MKQAAGKTAFFGLMIALAMILSYVESLLPFNLGIPGVKIGLPNIVTVFILYAGGVRPAVITAVLRIVLSGFLFGNMFSILYSLSGFALSILVMGILRKTDLFHMTAVSAAGGVAHNLGQLVTAILLTNLYTAVYLPVLLLSGIVSGLLVGIAAALISKRLLGLWKKL